MAEVFEPALLSMEENRFLLHHAGEPIEIALDEDERLPKGVNRRAVEPVLERLYRLEELRKKKQRPWAGIQAIKDTIAAYLTWMDTCAKVKARGGPANPSFYLYDSQGKAVRGAIGTDSGYVRSRIVGKGNQRVTFAVDLLEPNPELTRPEDVMPWLQTGDPAKALAAAANPDTVAEVNDPDLPLGSLQCSICHKTIEFKTNNRKTYNMARAQMSRHLLSTRTEVDRHRILHHLYVG